jgi:succinylarginine dihydrolase
VHAGVKFDEALHVKLTAWVEKHYRDRLSPDDLRDPEFAQQALEALEDLQNLLGMEGLYVL